VFAVAAIACQIVYPLVHGETLTKVTIATVAAFFAASILHALLHRGWAWTFGYVVIAVGGGLAVEAVGLRTGWPFGHYAYTENLGTTVWDVPIIVPLAWGMFAYPALLVGRRLSRRYAWLIGALALASWDLFLDPQMVAADHWHWSDLSFTLHGIPDVPVSNFAGWLVVALVMMWLLDRLPREGGLAGGRKRVSDALPATLFLWTYAASVLANLAFFDRTPVAVAGGLAMGLVALPYAVSLWAARP
jgi:putative membrane protein